MRIQRERTINVLESVMAGVAAKELIDQSNCFVLRKGVVHTFDDTIACSTQSPFGDIEGAVQAKSLLDYLRKMPEDDIDVEQSNGEFIIKGKKKRSKIRFEAEILLPVDNITVPTEGWFELSEDFCEAIGIVQNCAGKKDDEFVCTCLHIKPDLVEASDNVRVARYPIQTGYDQSILVHAKSISHISSLGMTESAYSDEWVHFRNPDGLTFSCRRVIGQDYLDWSPFLDVVGEKIVLPANLAESVGRMEVFSAENVESNTLEIQLKSGRMMMLGRGANGQAEEIREIIYNGSDIRFAINPKLLLELDKYASECQVIPYDADSDIAGRIKIDTGKFVYASCLAVSE